MDNRDLQSCGLDLAGCMALLATANSRQAQQAVTFIPGTGIWLLHIQAPDCTPVHTATVLEEGATCQVDGMTIVAATNARARTVITVQRVAKDIVSQ